MSMCLWPWPWWAGGVCVVCVVCVVCGCWVWCVLGLSVVGLGLVVAGVVCVGGWALWEMGMWVSVVSGMWSVWVVDGVGCDWALVVGWWAVVLVWLCMWVLVGGGVWGGVGWLWGIGIW